MIEVVCGVIYKGDEVFLCRRKPSKQMGGFWEFPGGKIEKDEKPEDALKRELEEEFEMKVEEIEYFYSTIHSYEKFTIRLSAFKCQFIESKYKLTDHDRFEWMSIDSIDSKVLAPADVPILEKLLVES